MIEYKIGDEVYITKGSTAGEFRTITNISKKGVYFEFVLYDRHDYDMLYVQVGEEYPFIHASKEVVNHVQCNEILGMLSTLKESQDNVNDILNEFIKNILRNEIPKSLPIRKHMDNVLTTDNDSWMFPDFNSVSKVHDWKKYVSSDVAKYWNRLEPNVRKMLYDNFKELAEREEYD